MCPFSTLAKLLISLHFLVLSAPLLVPLFLLNELVRLVITLLFRVWLLPGSDGVYSYTNQAICQCICEFPKDSFNFSAFQASTIETCVTPNEAKLSRVLTQRFGYLCLQPDPNYDPNSHFRVLEPRRVSSAKDLESLVEALGRPFDNQKKPQWELIHVPEMPGGKTTGVILRWEHAYADGISIFGALSSDQPDFPFYFSPYKDPVPSLARLLFYLKELPFLGYGILQTFLRNWSSSALPHQATKGDDAYFMTSFTFPLEEMKGISKKNGNASFNAIILSAFERALASSFGPAFDLCKIVIIGGFPYERRKVENRLSLLSIPKGKLDLKTLTEQTRVTQNDTFLAGMLLHRYLFGRFPVALNRFLCLKFKNGLITTNLPLSPEPVTFSGFPVEGCSTYANAYNSLNITMFSCKESLRVCVTCSSALMGRAELKGLTGVVENALNSMN